MATRSLKAQALQLLDQPLHAGGGIGDRGDGVVDEVRVAPVLFGVGHQQRELGREVLRALGLEHLVPRGRAVAEHERGHAGRVGDQHLPGPGDAGVDDRALGQTVLGQHRVDHARPLLDVRGARGEPRADDEARGEGRRDGVVSVGLDGLAGGAPGGAVLPA